MAEKRPEQVVLIMQGGGALGAFQAGVYEAMHEAGMEPDWVVGTSIGAINAALIVGNEPSERLVRLREFWALVSSATTSAALWNVPGSGNLVQNLGAVANGVPGFFTPNYRALLGGQASPGAAAASYYQVKPLRQTLDRLVDFGYLADGKIRLTLGAVNVRSGRMRYFDSRVDAIHLDHVMASGALPPAFPAVNIDGEWYWDGGVYSNTPIEVVMDDSPRRNSLIFATRLWQQEGDAPQSISQVMSRYKDIQYASRVDSHTARQQQIHHLRHVVRQLGSLLPASQIEKPAVRDLLALGCGTVMHVISLQAPAREDDDHLKDLDFTPTGIAARWDAGRDFARRQIAAAPWNEAVDPVMGIVVHR